MCNAFNVDYKVLDDLRKEIDPDFLDGNLDKYRPHF